MTESPSHRGRCHEFEVLPDGKQVAIIDAAGRATVHEISRNLAAVSPWFPDFIEAIAAQRVREDGEVEATPFTPLEILAPPGRRENAAVTASLRNGWSISLKTGRPLSKTRNTDARGVEAFQPQEKLPRTSHFSASPSAVRARGIAVDSPRAR